MVSSVDDGIDRAVLGDPNRIQQILVNYIANAVKFTEKGTITLRARLLSEDQAEQVVQFEYV